MNAHFSNAVNSVAFTWGTEKVYHAAQFGWGPLDIELPRRAHRMDSPSGAPHEEWMRGAQNDARIRANDLEAFKQSKSPLRLPDFLEEPFEGNETGPEVWTDEDEAMLQRLFHKKINRPPRVHQGKWDTIGVETENPDFTPADEQQTAELRDRRGSLTGFRY